MPTIKDNILFEDKQRGGPDLLKIEFQFGPEELNQSFIAKVFYRLKGGGRFSPSSDSWQHLFEWILEPKSVLLVETLTPNIPKTSAFQQQVQFKVVLLQEAAKKESKAFMLRD